ncbi:phosphate ABC transporter substrate-binding protein PstS [Isoptericola chiayiensis]|uniref:phosphate ABC transporter substrate-binding protein PstS n=1 Tax=Isoptericola chiayiensis TaxID=579446 RepID=UPI001552B1BB|nr:phosphate ABC transporter substrate-binding protein PstS [Isoptericola chiayiensis]NOV99596.1 phosphate transport system substrate-binding protein [Isoptericola chiayiensis]
MERLVNLSRFTRAGSAVAVGVLALSLAACGSDPEPADATGDETTEASESGDDMEGGLSGTLSGGGASSQEAAMNAWRAGFQQANPEATVNYDPVGSGGGRTGFGDGSYAFAGSDAALDDEELAAAEAQCGEGGVIEFPGYVSPVAVAFNLEGVDSLNMSPETIANVFLGEITTWDDEAIAADNPDADLPSTAITVVHRSDESGTTENFEDYLYSAAGDVWTTEPSGVWPVDGQESAQGTSGVVGAAQAGEGTITYADASQIADLGTVAVGVGGDFVEYSAEAAAEVVAQSPRTEGTSEYVYTIELERDIEGTYPIVLVSYSLACTTYADENTAELVKGFLGYLASEEGQQAAADAAGSAPLSDTIRQAVLPGIESISVG